MKTLLTLAAAAAALGMVPAAAAAQPAAQRPADAVSAASQASPAQPEEVSDPAVANITGEEPSNAQVALSTTAPDPVIGQPTGEMGLQPQVTELGRDLAWFHNDLLMPIITAISIFVLGLLLYVVVRFRRSAHPAPSRTTHNTTLEIVWTLVPVLILVVIALPSIDLLRAQYSPPKADLTVKAIGNQWRWDYEYPDHGVSLTANMLSDADAKKRGEPRLLAVDERVVVPVGATVKVIVTSADVVHSWGVPAFWVKIDAVPGRLNQTWFKADRPGVYYGQCFELCGARHAYMPIAVEVVTPAQFAAWVAAKGGAMPGAAPPSPDATATSPITNPTAAAAPGGSEATPEPTLTPGTATPPVTNQAAESSRGNP
jgi:cytochrome c oxidase subunit II